MVPFVIWDISVTGKHWWFNESYTIGLPVLKLPLEEWLFFITVPFACLFIWQILVTTQPRKSLAYSSRIFLSAAIIILGMGLVTLKIGKIYTSLAAFAVSGSIGLDFLLKTKILSQPQTIWYLSIVTLLMILFNGYLTARPVVLYDPAYQLNLRFLSIPVEDFIYGYALILLNTIVYETVKRRQN